MIRVFIIDENSTKKEIDGFIDVEGVEFVDVTETDPETGQEIVTKQKQPVVHKEPARIPNPDYEPHFVAVNTDNEDDAQNLLSQGAYEIPSDEVEKIFGDNANWVSPLTTEVSEDGKTILSFTPPPGPSEAQKARVRISELKANLMATDYVASKIAEGAATKDDYAQVLADRQEWRSEINELEKVINESK